MSSICCRSLLVVAVWACAGLFVGVPVRAQEAVTDAPATRPADTPNDASTPESDPESDPTPDAATPANTGPATEADAESQPNDIASHVKGCVVEEGLFRTYRDNAGGRILIEFPAEAPPETDRDASNVLAEFLYVHALRTGLGSNPVGLDRGKLGPARILRVRRYGPRVLFEEPNLDYRALTMNPDERRAVAESFATSVHWGTDILAESDGRIVLDLTSFLVRDAFGVAGDLADADQGSFQLDPKRSALDVAAALSFPDNLEFEAVLTFGSTKPGRYVRETAPTANAVTIVQHHSFVRLPKPGYRPRIADPRAGFFSISFHDYASPIDVPLEKSWIIRHRLERLPGGAVREPIVYYVDRGAPSPIREALIDGARWWAAAFEAAGYKDAFHVDVLPADAHPLDVRYNMIQWVHRSTRGWSYGASVVDPRTGEIIKGHVSLGSLRVRQDRLLFEGLIGTASTGSGSEVDPVKLSLARIRQLSAHEVGHTLGLAHNFAASTYAGRASVMDYPAPLIGITESGGFDFSNVYGVGVGAWDVQAIHYGYQHFEPADEAAGLKRILDRGIASGRIYLSDADARPGGAAHPLAALWDNGSDPIAGLEHAMRVRELALSRFGEHAIAEGRPMTRLEEVLVPVYLHHRYQAAAAAKSIAGVRYARRVRGDENDPPSTVDAETQRRAMTVLLQCVRPKFLDLPPRILNLIEPRTGGEGEALGTLMAPAFDRVHAAAIAADLVFKELCQPQRCTRLFDQQLVDPRLPGLAEMLVAVRDVVFDETLMEARLLGIQVAVQNAWIDRLITLASAPNLAPTVQARVETELVFIQKKSADRKIRRFLERAQQTKGTIEHPEAPPGSPIGYEPPPHLCGCSHGG